MNTQHSISNKQLELIFNNHSYTAYLRAVVEENKAINQRNQRTIDLIDAYHSDRPLDYTKLNTLKNQLPADLNNLRCRVVRMLIELDNYEFDQLWLSNQLNHVLPELIAKKWMMRNWSLPFFRQSCLAQTKLDFLLNPTEKVGNYLRNKQSEFYDMFLRTCQSAPSYRIDCRNLFEPYLRPLDAITYEFRRGRVSQENNLYNFRQN